MKRRRCVQFVELYKPIMDEALDAADGIRISLGIPKHFGSGNRRKGRVKFASAGYAILLVLYRGSKAWGQSGFYSQPEPSMAQRRIVELASQFYGRPERLDEQEAIVAMRTSERYTGWSSMGSLVSDHGYVESYNQSRQKFFRLTAVGEATAEVLS